MRNIPNPAAEGKTVLTDWYDHAHAYDIVFDTDTVADANGLATIANAYLERAPRRILEPACGSGRLVRELTRRGLEVTGFDLNRSMVSYTTRRLAEEGLSARVVEADMRAFDVGRGFDLAHCLISSFKHLGRERDARAHLTNLAAALRPGGIYVLGFHLTDYDDRQEEREVWSATRDGLKVRTQLTARAADPRRRRERMELRMDIDGPGGRHRVATNWWFRTYDAAQVRSLLRPVGDLELAGVLDFDFEPGELDDERLDTILVLRRR